MESYVCMEGVSLVRGPLHWWFSGVFGGGVQRRTRRRGGGQTEDVHTHWPWRLRSPLKVPSHSVTQSSCRICCGSGGTLLSCAVYAASKRAKKRRGSKRVLEEEEWGREREGVQTMSFCSGGNAAVNFAAPWGHITSNHEAQSECREVSTPSASVRDLSGGTHLFPF